MKKKSLLFFSIFALFMLILVGCGGNSQEPSNSENNQGNANGGTEDTSPIKVGVIGDFSGVSVDMGVTMRNGIQLAVDEFNEAGGLDGRLIEVKLYDDEGNPTSATTGAQKLIEEDKVVAILGNPNTATAIATVNVSVAKEVPQIVPIAQSPEILEPFSPWSFRVSATNPMDIDALLEYAKGQGWKKVGLLYDTSAYGMSGYQILKDAIPASGLELSQEEAYTVGATDLTPQALNLRKAEVDFVLMWGLGADAGRFVKDVERINWDIPILGGRGTTFEIFTKMGESAADDTIATAAIDLNKKAAQDFLAAYENKFGPAGSPDFAALGYDAASVLIEALKKAGSANATDRQQVRDAIESITDFTSVTGPEGAKISFSPDNHEGASPENVVLVKHENGGWVPLD